MNRQRMNKTRDFWGRRNKGFTLIELLVVVAIIAVLVSILLPSLSKARDMAKLVVCESNIRQIGMGWVYYADDNNDVLPTGLSWGSSGYGFAAWWWCEGGIGRYMPTPTIRDNSLPAAERDKWTIDTVYKGWYCPARTNELLTESFGNIYGQWPNYNVNTWTSFDLGYGGWDGVISRTQIPDPSRTPLQFCFWDAIPISVGPQGNYFSCPQYAANEDGDWRSYRFYSGVTSTHMSGTDFLFADGHAEIVPRQPSFLEYAVDLHFDWDPSRDNENEHLQ